MPVPVKKPIDEAVLKQRIVEEKAKKETEEKRRRTVFNAIEALADTVDEEKLLSLLDVLDVTSWKEVVEERFIGRLCGFPTCQNDIIVKSSQKYKLDKNKQKVYENYADSEKFCSSLCLQKSEYLQSQLAELPLWLTGERCAKNYDLFLPQTLRIQSKLSNEEKNVNEKIEFVPDTLLAQLNSLNLGQIDASESEDEDDENTADASTLGVDDKQFLSNVHSFITAKMPAANSRNNTQKIPQQDSVQKKVIKKMDKETVESKLEKLRSKFGKEPKEKQKKKPIMIEPHRDATPIKSKKDGVIKAEEVVERLRQWITPKTIEYIDEQAATEHPTRSTDVPGENAANEGDVSSQQVIEQFYTAILDPREYDKKKAKEEEIKSVKLPLVDSIDQHFRRVEIVLNGLKKAWVSYVGQLKISYPVNNTKNLISTFGLNKDNCVIDPKTSEYFATAILQIMIHCSKDLKELLQREETLEYHQRYYDLLQIDFDFFNSKLTEIINSKRHELVDQSNEEGDEMEC